MKDLLEFPVKGMIVFGYLVPNPNSNAYIRLLISELSILITLIVSIINYFYADGFFEYIDNFEGTSSMFLVFSKLTCCVFYKNKIYNLMESRSSFWDTENCSKTVKNNIIAMTVGFIFPSSIMARKLPLGTFYIYDYFTIYYFMAWSACAVACIVGACCVICFILIFLGVCYEVIIQFRILYDHLERLNVENINSKEEYDDFFRKLKLCLEHHKFLQRFLRDMQNCFAIPLLFMYMSTLPVSCMFMYAAFESPSIGIRISRILASVNVLLLFGIYCLAVTYMTDEASKISNAIYYSNWYSRHYTKLKKSTQLMIQQAQREVRITILGGFTDVHIATFINVARASFSICTVLRSLKD